MYIPTDVLHMPFRSAAVDGDDRGAQYRRDKGPFTELGKPRGADCKQDVFSLAFQDCSNQNFLEAPMSMEPLSKTTNRKLLTRESKTGQGVE